jgi:uncharacterized membrane protein
MTNTAHVWAIGFADIDRAEEVRREIIELGEKRCLIVLDTAVVVRYSDGLVTLDGEPFRDITKAGGHGIAGFLAGLALAAPLLTAPAVAAGVEYGGSGARDTEIDESFVSDVKSLIKPGTSALFVLDQECNMEAILQGIRGLGGTVLKTNVNLERAKLIQSTLSASTAVANDTPGCI